MSKRATDAAWKLYPDYPSMDGGYITQRKQRELVMKGYEQAEKDTIERAVAWLEETFFDNSHHSGRGSYGQIETNDFDSMEEMIEKFKKAMEDKE